jgi:hypothetical protein
MNQKSELPPDELVEQLAEAVHASWMNIRTQQGWTYGASRNDTLKEHPSMIPYSDLSETEKEVDRATVRQVLDALTHLGYSLTK